MMVQKEDLGLSLSLNFPEKTRAFSSHHSSSPSPFSLINKTSWPEAFSDRRPEACRAETRSFLKGIDVNCLPTTEEEGGVSSPNSTVSSVSGKRREKGKSSPQIHTAVTRTAMARRRQPFAANSAYMTLESFQKAAHNGKLKDFSVYSHEARRIKSEAELNLMRNSASIACQALLQTMLHSRSFPDEGMLSAKVEYECKMRGAQRMAFNPVVGGGPNGGVIHYARNDQRIEDGDLVLMDVGCELHGYVSDLTRTWPPCGKFSSAQEELYNLILETNEECVGLCKPGTSIQEIHNHSVNKLQKGFKELGILKSDQSHSYHLLNPTNIGHYLGMDVHDCSKIAYSRTLEPGVVITIEPGVYIPSNYNVPERYQGIGIRIEDEVLITESGYEVLTGSLPKKISHLETLLNGRGVETHNAIRTA